MKKNLWPYMIILVFILFATFIVNFVVRSMQTRVELVSEDYYAQEIKYQGEIDKIKRTNDLGAGLDIQYEKTDQVVSLNFPDTLSIKEGTISFYRPSDSKLDFEVALATQNRQELDVSEVISGLWMMQIDFTSESNTSYYYEQKLFID